MQINKDSAIPLDEQRASRSWDAMSKCCTSTVYPRSRSPLRVATSCVGSESSGSAPAREGQEGIVLPVCITYACDRRDVGSQAARICVMNTGLPGRRQVTRHACVAHAVRARRMQSCASRQKSHIYIAFQSSRSSPGVEHVTCSVSVALRYTRSQLCSAATCTRLRLCGAVVITACSRKFDTLLILAGFVLIPMGNSNRDACFVYIIIMTPINTNTNTKLHTENTQIASSELYKLRLIRYLGRWTNILSHGCWV